MALPFALKWVAAALAATALALGSLHAAASAPGQPETQICLVGVGGAALPDALSYLDGKGVVVTVVVPKSGRGAPIHYTGSSPLVLFIQKTDAKGNTIQIPLASVAYPANWTKVLVVLIATGGAGTPLKALVFDDSPEGFPREHALVLNFFPGALAVDNFGKIVQIAPGKAAQLALQNKGGRTWFRLAVHRPSGAWEALPYCITQMTPGMRVLVFAYEERSPDGLMLPVYRTITEAPPPEEPKAKAVASR